MSGTSSPATTSADQAVDVGMAMARKIFEKRGNHSEIHLSEGELAGLLGAAYAANAAPSAEGVASREWKVEEGCSYPPDGVISNAAPQATEGSATASGDKVRQSAEQSAGRASAQSSGVQVPEPAVAAPVTPSTEGDDIDCPKCGAPCIMERGSDPFTFHYHYRASPSSTERGTDNYYGDLARQRGDAYALMVACDEIDKLKAAQSAKEGNPWR